MKKIVFTLITIMTLSMVLSCDPFANPAEPTDEQMDLLTRSYKVVDQLRHENVELWKVKTNPDDGTEVWTLLKPFPDGEWGMEVTSARYWGEYKGSLYYGHLDYRFRYIGERRHTVEFRMTRDRGTGEILAVDGKLDGHPLIVVPEGMHPAIPLI